MPDRQENVVIAVGDCSLTLLPALGGKIASLRVGKDELLQAPLKPYALRTRTMDFADADASGWDECLPTVSACTIQTAAGPASLPDHGDLWRVPWQVLDTAPDSATMRATGFSLPLELTRSLILTQSPEGYRLSILYTIANRGTTPLPWAWAAHPLFACAPGDRIVLPPSIRSLRVEGSSGNRLRPKGSKGDTVNWPVTTLADNTTDDLSLAKPASTGTGDKLFAGPLTAGQGWSTLERPAIGLSLTLRFDPAKTPYLGLWLCYGGWPDGPGAKQVAIALEPTNAPADSLAGPFPAAALALPSFAPPTLAPGETFSWPMDLEINRIKHVEANATDRTPQSTEGNRA